MSLVRIDVSEEHVAFTFRMQRIRELGSTSSVAVRLDYSARNNNYAKFKDVGRTYIRQRGCSADTILQEYCRHFRLDNPDKLAVADHSDDMEHHKRFHSTSILATKT
jgi:hypothetical protein